MDAQIRPCPLGTNISEWYSQCDDCNVITNEWYEARKVMLIQMYQSFSKVSLGPWRIVCPDCFDTNNYIDIDGARIHHLSKGGYQCV